MLFYKMAIYQDFHLAENFELVRYAFTDIGHVKILFEFGEQFENEEHERIWI